MFRSRLLAGINDRVAARFCAELTRDRVPAYIVVTPELCHLAPLAARNHPPAIQPVFVANGISMGDRAWLARLAPDVPIMPLRSSLRGKAASLLHHGLVIEHLARATPHATFCIQDADCFVTEAPFWNSMSLDTSREYAVGPFQRSSEDGRPAFPETFLVCLNRVLMDRFCRESGITPAATPSPGSLAAALLARAGFPQGRYLELRKQYFDTLQQYWIAAEYEGYLYRLVPGAGESVHHVGGTSYLHRKFDDLAHWDYWPLNVHYFHLRLLELPACAEFRARFESLFEFHGSSRSLLEKYPEYATGRRRAESDRIINGTSAAALYDHVTA